LQYVCKERFPDKCQEDPERVKRLNIEATRVIAKATAAQNAVLVYISTDYVFDGKRGDAPYAPDAKTNPPNFYGETKLAGENAVLEEGGGRSVILRVPVGTSFIIFLMGLVHPIM